MPLPTLYILYNAHSTLLGKLSYTCRKLTSSTADDPACAACDITHGGLHLNESKAWRDAKARISFSDARGEIKQLHIDEVSEQEVKSFVKSHELRYPMVLVRPVSDPAEIRLLVSREELAACKGDPGAFLDVLGEKGGEVGVFVEGKGDIRAKV